jgi:hypothetical protein
LIPTTQHAQPDSLPFLLVRPNAPTMKADVLDEDGETEEIPCSRSVPPHAPPAPLSTTEHELPSVIVDPAALGSAGSDTIDRLQATEVDGLLTASEPVEFVIPFDEQPTLDTESETLRSAAKARARFRSRSSGRGRGFAIAAVAALMAAGGTFVGMRVYHVAGFPLSAASHLVR